ncbi:YciI-like protein [compost metagenome]|uniref:YciI family protein n=1 Tax=Pseudomonas sp. GL-R-19 TaxID=2832391 RepID=UPI000F954360|nr:YciI family protein [Pseudomonas sp. GL-R-19]
MPYVIKFHDDPDVTERKKDLRAVHLEYVNKNAPRIIASGGLFPDDDDFPVGGLIILDTEERQEAVDYIENDPFYLNGIFTNYTIDKWRKFIFDHRRVNP